VSDAPLPSGDGWRDAIAAGRFDEAERLRAIAVAAGSEVDDEDERAALRSLAAIQAALRSKSWRIADRRAAEPYAWPSWVDGARIASDVAALAIAGAALQRREVDAAMDALRELQDLPPGPFEAERLTQLGTAHILDGRDDEARSCFTRALEADPAHPRALVNLGNVALEAGEVDAAIEHYQRALRVDDDFANAHHNLGVAYRRKGMIGKSVASLRRAQRSERKRETREAREDVRGLRARGGGRVLRWVLGITLAALIVWWFVLR
jgi:tetratricopeptide (TPR) repeat protein